MKKNKPMIIKSKTFFSAFYFVLSMFLASCIFFSSWNLSGQSNTDLTKKWVGTWSCAPYAAENNTPPSPYLANNTLRQIVRVSIGGDTLRVKFSNSTCSTPVTMNSVSIALSTNGSAIDTTTIKLLKFNGNDSVTINAYSSITSDPIAFQLTPGMHLGISIYYGQCQTSSDMTFHYGSRTDSYILADDHITSFEFKGATTVERWYTISAVDVLAPAQAGAVVAFGNSITDGYGLHNGPKNKWTDFFSDKLLNNPNTSQVSVLNLGIGATWLTTSGVTRFKQDVLNQSGLSWIIIFYGVNDIGGNLNAAKIINAYKQLIYEAHAQNIKVYGATITPFKGHSYYTADHEAVRVEVNKWIRAPGNFDKCIDIDKAIRNPSDTAKLQATYSNDWLHPNADGYKFIGESIDLKLFERSDTIFSNIDTTETGSIFFKDEYATVRNDY